MSLAIVILAAGQGTRMRSRLPKVLHPLGGRPMLQHVIDTAHQLAADEIAVVVGHGAEQVQAAIDDPAVRWVLQAEQLGTGHAVAQALPVLEADDVLVLYGDVPLVRAELLRPLVDGLAVGRIHLLTVTLDDPTGYGRIVRDERGEVRRIVEQKDADADTLRIREGNTGILAARRADLARWLDEVDDDNAQGEFYLTDVIEHCIAGGGHVQAWRVDDELAVAGVNDKRQLNRMERAYQHQQADRLLAAGVTLADRARIDVRGELVAGRDVSIDINCVFEGRVVLGDDVTIGPNCLLRDVEIGDGVQVHANSVLEGSVVEADCQVGPFARLRPGTRLRRGAKAGNFVEIKQGDIGEGSKVNHLSYIGDARLGRDVNIGAGTITCNYDGARKHHTDIGDGAFIGSNSALVAPVTIGAEATIGAGSVITREAPAGQLTLARERQTTVPHWKRPKKGDH